jgi:hypothetical protein
VPTDLLPEERLWTGIQRVLECYCSCTETTSRYLGSSGPGVETLLQSLLDCAEVCRTTSGFLLRDSALRADLASICAEACGRSARHCERFGDDLLRQCAEACRRCADACRELLHTDSASGAATAPTPRWGPPAAVRVARPAPPTPAHSFEPDPRPPARSGPAR